MTQNATQVYQVFIKATPEAIWDAITQPEFTAKYFYGARITATPERYRALSPTDEVWNDDAVLEFDPLGGSSTAGGRSTARSWPRRRRVA